ncbi:hypothetical protein BST81_17610 [Leptolyngbya sp. 'hensonii']|uniref:pentapeptide repeat-containing protein n=1 Tax=Leptolyngbya sp. 'hensonii' TaxID=1922337 RepID=UPI00094F4CF9|nr:pentapeptide repeat-containing protein [Leptolyngbya sp. 'hensonii']OLP17167.1 hypothetical protein BST81_17610 [Leptolyngbya sp. 'hensonii']
MANYQHLVLLKQDVARWNRWRRDNPGVQVDLIGVDLSGLHLRWADLREASLLGAVLEQANLTGVDLRWADLTDANLKGADLRGANLCFANLRGANLAQANLRAADLREAELQDTNLDQADLTGATLPRSPQSSDPLSTSEAQVPVNPHQTQEHPLANPAQSVLSANSSGAELVSPIVTTEPERERLAQEETLEIPADKLKSLIESARAHSHKMQAQQTSSASLGSPAGQPASSVAEPVYDTLEEWLQE